MNAFQPEDFGLLEQLHKQELRELERLVFDKSETSTRLSYCSEQVEKQAERVDALARALNAARNAPRRGDSNV